MESQMLRQFKLLAQLEISDVAGAEKVVEVLNFDTIKIEGGDEPAEIGFPLVEVHVVTGFS